MTGYADLGYARVDTDREERQGLPEVIYAPGKDDDEIAGIASRLLAEGTGPVLVSRLSHTRADSVRSLVGGGGGVYDETARLLLWRPRTPADFQVRIVTAGTADGPVAAETAAVADAVGLSAELIADVGVAGMHRLYAVLDQLNDADVVIVVAGMEGALASAVGGLVGSPVIAVPTSTGYGAALEGVTALLAMLSSCAAGLTVVNIDSGFGAAMAAHRLARTMHSRR